MSTLTGTALELNGFRHDGQETKGTPVSTSRLPEDYQTVRSFEKTDARSVAMLARVMGCGPELAGGTASAMPLGERHKTGRSGYAFGTAERPP